MTALRSLARQGAQTRPIDPRGQRFAAAITTAVLAGVLVAESPWLLAAQAAVFAVGAALGPARSPYALLFRTLVRPRLGPPGHTEDPAPPRFAQAVGLAFALAGLAGAVAGLPGLFLVATAAALAAAFLNAAFGLCLGCEAYVLLLRARPRARTRSTRSRTAPSLTTEVSR